MRRIVLVSIVSIFIFGCGQPPDTKEIATPRLLEACLKGDFEAVKKSLDQFPELANARDKENNMPPLLRASERGHVEIVKLLLAKKADVKAVGGLSTFPNETHG